MFLYYFSVKKDMPFHKRRWLIVSIVALIAISLGVYLIYWNSRIIGVGHRYDFLEITNIHMSKSNVVLTVNFTVKNIGAGDPTIKSIAIEGNSSLSKERVTFKMSTPMVIKQEGSITYVFDLPVETFYANQTATIYVYTDSYTWENGVYGPTKFYKQVLIP